MKWSKKRNYLSKYGAKKVQVSKVLGKETSALEIKCLINVSQKHTKFHASMTAEEMVGIIDFHVTETVYSASDFSKPVATMNLYNVLYNYVKMEDGNSLISKTHQQGHMLAPWVATTAAWFRARAHGAGFVRTLHTQLLARFRALPYPDNESHGVGSGGGGQGRRPASEATRKDGASGTRIRTPTKLLSRS